MQPATRSVPRYAGRRRPRETRGTPLDEPAPTARRRVVLVANDEDLAGPVMACLRKLQFGVDQARSAPEVRGLVASVSPGAVILDLAPPEADALNICREITALGNVGVLVCSRSPHQWARAALRLGAGDFVRKPVDLDELVIRLELVLCRTAAASLGRGPRAMAIQVGDLAIVPATHRVDVDGVPIKLTATEYRLLLVLAKHPEIVSSRDDLTALLWRRSGGIDHHLLATYVGRLRKKLAASTARIRTIRGRGYVLAPGDSVP